jgi:hypothetical protein
MRLAVIAVIAVGALALLAASACGNRDGEPAAADDAARPKRVFDPPPGEVRPVPPFAIRSDGVGPYLIGASMKEVLDLIPRGPRIELLNIEGVAGYDLVRSEGRALVIGGGESRVRFVVVVEPEIAKSASGIGVGATSVELVEALGDPAAPADRAADPAVREFGSLPGVRFILARGKVAAVIVAPRDGVQEPDPPESVECRAGGSLREARGAIVDAAKVGDDKQVTIRFGCITGSSPEAVVTGPDKIAIVSGEPDKLKRVASRRATGVRYAAPIDLDRDARDEIGVVYIDRVPEQSIEARVELWRWDGGKLAAVASDTVYEVDDEAAAITGARVDDVDLLLELTAADKNLSVGGVYVHRSKGRTREVAPLVEQVVRVKKDRPK